MEVDIKMYNIDYNLSIPPKLDISRTLLIGAAISSLALSSPVRSENECLTQNIMEMAINDKINNYYNSSMQFIGSNSKCVTNRVDYYAEFVFGKMRNATDEEKNSVYEYMKKTSKRTGVNLFDLC